MSCFRYFGLPEYLVSGIYSSLNVCFLNDVFLLLNECLFEEMFVLVLEQSLEAP